MPQDCPKGHFCLVGSSLPLPCPVVRVKYRFVFQAAIFRRVPIPRQGHPGALSVQGSYSDVERAGSCQPCPAGMFCSRAGLPEPEGHCQPGHFCTQGSSTSSPVSAEFLHCSELSGSTKAFRNHNKLDFDSLPSGGASIRRSLPTRTLLPSWHQAPQGDAVSCWHLEWPERSPRCHLVPALCPWVLLQRVWPRCSCGTLCTR